MSPRNLGLTLFFACLVACSPAAPTPTPGPVRRSDAAELVYSYCQKPYCLKPTPSVQNPAFSPDNRLIMYTIFWKGYNRGSAGIYRIMLDSQMLYPLIDEDDHIAVNLPGSSWHPATKRVAFASDREAACEIWVVNEDGSYLKRVTYHTGPEHFSAPTFSPDGNWLVFEARPPDTANKPLGSIWKVRLDGTGLTQLTDGPADGVDDRRPNWSPTGERILFQRRAADSTNWDIYTLTPDGENLRRITTAAAADVEATWSPNGKWIVYSTTNDELEFPNIYAIPATGGTPRRITHDSEHEDAAPSWSPDGRWIAFESRATTEQDLPATLWRIAVPAGIEE